MNPLEKREDLKEQVRTADGTQAQARNGRAMKVQAEARLARELEDIRTQLARHGSDPELKRLFEAASDELAALRAGIREDDLTEEAGARGVRDAGTELEFLYLDELATFLLEARTYAEAAEGAVAALAAPIAEAHAAWQAAALRWAQLANAMRTTLQDQDEKAGKWPSAGHYSRATVMPTFPIVFGGEVQARPPAVDLLQPSPTKQTA